MPNSDNRFARQNCFGPPSGFPAPFHIVYFNYFFSFSQTTITWSVFVLLVLNDIFVFVSFIFIFGIFSFCICCFDLSYSYLCTVGFMDISTFCSRWTSIQRFILQTVALTYFFCIIAVKRILRKCRVVRVFITGVIVTPINWVGNIEIHTDCASFQRFCFLNFWNRRRDGRLLRMIGMVPSIHFVDFFCLWNL